MESKGSRPDDQDNAAAASAPEPVTMIMRWIDTWSRRSDDATPIREMLPSIPRAFRPRTGKERGLMKARALLDSRRAGDLTAWVAAPRNEELLAGLGPFLGDDRLGTWPFQDPFNIGDEDAATWLRALGQYAAPNESIRRFVLLFFLARRRSLWVPAADALGKLSARDHHLEEIVAGLWRRHYPKGIPARWLHSSVFDDRETKTLSSAERKRAVHTARHLLRAASAFMASGGQADALAGFDISALARSPMRQLNASDASAVLLAFPPAITNLLSRRDLITQLVDRILEAPADDLVDVALHELLDSLESDDAGASLAEAIRERLARPSWRELRGFRRLDTLWSWLSTARVFREAGAENLVAEMRRHAGEAERALSLRLGEVAPGLDRLPLEQLIAHVRDLFDPDTYATTAEPCRVACVAETMILLEREEVRHLPWESIVARAVGRPLITTATITSGAAGSAGRVDLALLTAVSEAGSSVLLRDLEFDTSTVLRLASSQSGLVARQVAIQLERLLRQSTSNSARIRLLWAVLRSGPPLDTFAELTDVLRRLPPEVGGETDPIAPLVDSLLVLRARLAEAPLNRGAIIEAHVAVLDIVQSVLSERRRPDDDAPPCLRALRDALRALPPSSDGCESIAAPDLDLLRSLLAPSETGGAVDGWKCWLGVPSQGIGPAWRSFETAMEDFHRHAFAATTEQAQALEEATRRLKECLSASAAVEAWIVTELLDHVDRRRHRRFEASRRCERTRSQVCQMIESGDEPALRSLVRSDSPDLETLASDELQRLHAFLLNNLCLTDAHRLWVRFAGRARLQGVWNHLAPLFLGAAGGVFLVLDVGTAWNEVLVPGRGSRFVGTVAFALLCSFLLLIGSTSSRMSTRSTARFHRVRALLRSSWRAFPVFAASLFVAVSASGIVLWSLSDTSARVSGRDCVGFLSQLLLWGSLSQFFGLFVGLILQGNALVRNDT